MAFEHEIKSLEQEWSQENGFFWKIRQGQFSSGQFDALLGRIAKIAIDENAELPRRLVSLLWYAPTFMSWQTERVNENSGDTVMYQQAIDLMTNEIERLLWTP